MWIVYLRKNKINGRMYVGVTSTSLEERWNLQIKSANQATRVLEAYDKAKEGTPTERRLEKRVQRMVGTMDYEVATMGAGDEIWEHHVLAEEPNVVRALLREREEIARLNTQDPAVGYNRSPGGEVPHWVNIIDVVRAVRELDAGSYGYG